MPAVEWGLHDDITRVSNTPDAVGVGYDGAMEVAFFLDRFAWCRPNSQPGWTVGAMILHVDGKSDGGRVGSERDERSAAEV